MSRIVSTFANHVYFCENTPYASCRKQIQHAYWPMGWLRLVGSLKLQVSFAEYSLFYRALLQERPIILRSLLIAATPKHRMSCAAKPVLFTCRVVCQRSLPSFPLLPPHVTLSACRRCHLAHSLSTRPMNSLICVCTYSSLCTPMSLPAQTHFSEYVKRAERVITHIPFASPKYSLKSMHACSKL